MTINPLRREVLKSFKKLHRTGQFVFQNDKNILQSARKEINDNFKKNKNVTDIDSIKEMIKFAQDVTTELRTTVVELEETPRGTYKLKLRPEMFEEDNTTNEKLSK